MRRFSLRAALPILAIAQGCCIPMVPHYDDSPGRQNVERAMAGFPVVGATLRSEVLLQMGDPDEVHEGERVFIYRWKKRFGIFAIGGLGTAVTWPIRNSYYLRVEFDEKGVCSRVVEGPSSHSQDNEPNK